MSEIQPSLGELEDAQNTAYENFFTARDAAVHFRCIFKTYISIHF